MGARRAEPVPIIDDIGLSGCQVEPQPTACDLERLRQDGPGTELRAAGGATSVHRHQIATTTSLT